MQHGHKVALEFAPIATGGHKTDRQSWADSWPTLHKWIHYSTCCAISQYARAKAMTVEKRSWHASASRPLWLNTTPRPVPWPGTATEYSGGPSTRSGLNEDDGTLRLSHKQLVRDQSDGSWPRTFSRTLPRDYRLGNGGPILLDPTAQVPRNHTPLSSASVSLSLFSCSSESDVLRTLALKGSSLSSTLSASCASPSRNRADVSGRRYAFSSSMK
jgi:hypothetical protein